MAPLLKHWINVIRIAPWCALALVVAWPAPLLAGDHKVIVPQAAHRALTTAHGLMTKGDYAGAAKTLHAFQDGKPKWLKPGGRDPEGYLHYLVEFNLANSYLALDRPNEAIPHYESTLAAQPDFSPAWMNLAKACYDAGKYGYAAQCFLKGYESAEEKQPDVLYYAGVSYMSAKDHPQALSILQRLLSAYPDTVKMKWREQLVQVYMALEQPKRALPHIKILAEISQGVRQQQWQETLYYQYVTLNMEKKALAYARWLTRTYPEDSKWWKALARLNLEKEHHQEALASLMLNSYLRSISAQDLRLLADLSLSVGVPIQSARYYEQVIAKKGQPPDFKRWIQSYMRLHRPEKALSAANQALSRFDDPGIEMLRGEVLFDLKRYDETISALTRVVEKNPQTGRAWLMMGYAAWHLKEYALAKTALERAAAFRDQKKSAQRLLIEIEKQAPELIIDAHPS